MSETLYERLLSSRNYSDIAPGAVRRAVEDCERRYRKPKDIEKAVKERLHGITSAFMTGSEYKRALALAPRAAHDPDALLGLLECHASTRERLPLEATRALYRELFRMSGAPTGILDLACGLNPVFLHSEYGCPVEGIDISGSCVRVINEGLAAEGVHARCADLLDDDALPEGRYSTALMFKLLPLLERQQKGSAEALLARIPADRLIVSFPLRTLSGRNVGMEAQYSAWMEAHLPQGLEVAGVHVDRGRELYYILTRTG